MRVRSADGPPTAGMRHLPGETVWLVGERRDAGETTYHRTSHPAGTSLRALAAAITARWSCEQAHQQLNEELGLDHFEGRTWLGLHHHALLTLISFAFLQHLRLQHVEAARGRREKVGGARRSATRAVTPRAAAREQRAPRRRPSALPNVRCAAGRPAARVSVDAAEES